MSRRLPTSPTVVLLFLLAGAALAPFFMPPAAGFGERTFDWNQVINGTNHLDVYSGETVAQSFTPTVSYALLNVTLRLKNRGDLTDPLNVTIRPDATGVPATTYLAASNVVIGNPTLGQYDISFPGGAKLTAGGRYWIVAACSSLVTNAYEWHHSGADVYPAGKAMINLNVGGGWTDPSSPTDLYFVTYGREVDADLTTTIVATQSQVNAGELVTFRAFLNNTGSSIAPRAWVNDTQLPGLVYVSDTAAAAGASSAYPAFSFTNVGNGPRSFNITARVANNTEPGTVLSKVLTLVYANATGILKTSPSSQASVLVGKNAKQVYLNPDAVGAAERLTPTKPSGGPASQHNETLKKDGSAHDFDLAPVLARAFRVFGANATLYVDSAGHDVRNLDINLTLADWNGVTLIPIKSTQRRVTTNAFPDYEPFTFAFPGMDHTFTAGGRIRVTVRNMGSSGADLILAMNSTFASSRLDLDTTTYIRVDLLDMRDATQSTTVWSPKDTIAVLANVSDPFGSSEISGARINLTSPAGSLVVNSTALGLLTTDPSSPSAWKVFQFSYAPPLLEGLYRVTVTALESNGVKDLAESMALVRVPHFTLEKTATASNVRSGDRFNYDIWFNNTGPGTAGHAWINDTLPSQLTFVSSSDTAAMTGSYNWTWSALGPGNYRLSIRVQVKASLPPIPYFRNFAFLNFTDEKGFAWPAQSAFVDVAFRGPVITLSKTSATTLVHANETVAYTITMQNTGDAAQSLWVNDTLPAGMSYVSDTSASLGGTVTVSGGAIYFRFTNMPSLSTWSFTVSARAAPALVRGSTLVNVVGLNYTNSNRFLMPPKVASWSTGVVAPQIASASIFVSRTRVTPADIVSGIITYTNIGNEAARSSWINLTLDPNLYFLNASLVASVSGNAVRFVLAGVPIGPGSIFLNASVDASVTDHLLLTLNGTMTYSDGYGNILPTVAVAPDSVEAAVPRLVLSVTPGNGSVEAAGYAFYNIYQVNAGSGVAGDIWLTLPLPAGFVYVSDTSDGTRSVAGSTFTWHWTNVAPGPRSFSLELQAKASVLDGTGTDLVFHADYTDANGNFREGVTYIARANFVAPRIALVLSSGPGEARSGDLVRYNLTIVNLGSSTARNLWLTDAIDSRFEFVSYIARVQATGTNSRNWSFTDLQPGQQETVLLTLRIRGGTSGGSLLSNVFEANYTNSGGAVIGYVRSEAATTLIVTDPLPAIAGVAAVAATVVTILLFLRRSRVDIEEVFLVYRDGVLIYHLSRSLSQDKDEDVLSGMLTAIQEFVRDAFVYGEHRELHQLDFGDYRIMIERGDRVYLAVVYAGKSTVVRKRVRSVLDHIETAYRGVLEDWDGDMEKVAGARDLIREYLLKPAGKPFQGLSFL